MKTILGCVFVLISACASGQSIQGTWQLIDSKTCFQADMKESETEKELTSKMGSNSTSTVAKLIEFKKDGSGREGVFAAGKKRGDGMNSFQYKLNGQELNFTDKKSGMILQRFVIDELTETSLKIHDAVKDCETKAFIRVK
ncbi:hypothetical protein WSM22_45660 [Cytophagales bacterium WSM2-2]|nr:hypothetical protein WSM22_45660 [Cytophagales bacterium WSM2-2]